VRASKLPQTAWTCTKAARKGVARPEGLGKILTVRDKTVTGLRESAATERAQEVSLMSLGLQVAVLFLLAIPIACVAWTVTHEEVFREPREYCVRQSRECRRWYQRKFFYLFTCEYCFSHYITIFFLLITRYRLLYEDWRGYLIGGFALVWVANQYMSLYNRLRLDIKSEKIETSIKEKVAEKVKGGQEGDSR
jgi:hypothetical protein